MDYNILTDDDIYRLKRKADSLKPMDESVYTWLLSITTLFKINERRLEFSDSSKMNYFNKNYLTNSEANIKKTVKLYKNATYRGLRYKQNIKDLKI